MSVSCPKCYEQGEIWSIFWTKAITQIRLREVYSSHKAAQQEVELSLATTLLTKPQCFFLPHLFQQELPLFGSPRARNSLKDTILVKHHGFIFLELSFFQSLLVFFVKIIIFSLKLKLPNYIYSTMMQLLSSSVITGEIWSCSW